jgi:addiction module HigA family antidote
MGNRIIEENNLENYDGLLGDGTGHFDTVSENAKVSMERLKEYSSLEQPYLDIERKLLQLKWRMEDYLRNEFYIGQTDAAAILYECLQAIAVKHKDFADYIGIVPSNLSAMLKGRRRINAEFALKLEQIFDIPAHLWLGVQSKNELDQLRKSKSLLGPKLSRQELLAKAG